MVFDPCLKSAILYFTGVPAGWSGMVPFHQSMEPSAESSPAKKASGDLGCPLLLMPILGVEAIDRIINGAMIDSVLITSFYPQGRLDRRDLVEERCRGAAVSDMPKTMSLLLVVDWCSTLYREHIVPRHQRVGGHREHHPVGGFHGVCGQRGSRDRLCPHVITEHSRPIR